MNKEFLKQKPILKKIFDIVSAIDPIDDIKEAHIKDALEWITTAESIFRIKKPDVPNKHLVSGLIVFDEAAKKILLTDHKQAQRWMPTGGHVEINEDPKEAARRECMEELGIEAEFWVDDPIFLTSTITAGLTPGHTDVSLWYVLKGNHQAQYKFDTEEFHSIKWFTFDELLHKQFDPHMRRFLKKLQHIIQCKNNSNFFEDDN